MNLKRVTQSGSASSILVEKVFRLLVRARDPLMIDIIRNVVAVKTAKDLNIQIIFLARKSYFTNVAV